MTDETSAAPKAAKPKNVGGRPKVTETKEFKSALSAAVSAEMARLAPQIAAEVAAQMRAVNVANPQAIEARGGEIDVAQRMAGALQELADAGSNKKRMSPAEIQRRAEARERLLQMVKQVQDTNFEAPGTPEPPQYRIVAKTYLTDFVIEPFEVDPASKAMVPVVKFWTGIPNEAMVPVNDWAKAIHEVYMQSIGGPTAMTKNSDLRDVGVTPGGFVVRGLNASSRRTVATLPEGSTTDVMGIRNQSDPRAKKINVLGTVADPAVAGHAIDKPQQFSGGRLS